MTETIETTEDLLRLLDENQEFRAAVRRKILTDEVIELPVKIAALTEQVALLSKEFAKFAGDTNTRLDSLENHAAGTNTRLDSLENHAAETNTRLDSLENHAAETNTRLDGMDKRLDSLENHAAGTNTRLDGMDKRMDKFDSTLNGVRGDVLENKLPSSLRQRIGDALGLRRVRPIWLARSVGSSSAREIEYEQKAERAADEGVITDREEGRLLDTDMVVRGLRTSDGSVVYVAVEASGVIKIRDIERARSSADILRRIYGVDAIPAVYGYSIAPQQERQAEADEEAGLQRALVFLEDDE